MNALSIYLHSLHVTTINYAKALKRDSLKSDGPKSDILWRCYQMYTINDDDSNSGTGHTRPPFPSYKNASSFTKLPKHSPLLVPLQKSIDHIQL